MKSSPEQGGSAIVTRRPSLAEPAGGCFGGPFTSARGVVRQDQHLGDIRRQLDLLEPRSRQGGPDPRASGRAVSTARPVSIPSQTATLEVGIGPNRTAPPDPPEHHTRRGEVGLADPAVRALGKVGAVQADDLVVRFRTTPIIAG